ncbi:MAG: cation transporter [Sphingomonadales bacterium]
MSGDCSHIGHENELTVSVYRRVLWLVMAINAVMFLIEVGSGVFAGSVSLQADALDFLSDAANYAIALLVLGRSVRWRASTAIVRAIAMAGFGLYVLGYSYYRAVIAGVPQAIVMGSVGMLALAANVGSAFLLFRHRHGDSHRRSVWLCSRNDAIGNIAIIAAAGAVHVTGTGWPDVAVGVLIAALSLSAAFRITRQAMGELRGVRV